MRVVRLLAAMVLAASVASPLSPASAHCPQHMQHCAPGIVPPGANETTCESPGKPPVVLVHGTYGDMSGFWNVYIPALREHGYCVWVLDYGHRGTDDMETSVSQITAFVTLTVLRYSSTGTVSLIGHSQGGLQIRHMLRHDPSIPVQDAISLSGSHFGTDTPLAPGAAEHGACPACAQQIQGSEWMTQHMNTGDLTPGAASYTQIETIYDEIVTPYTNTLLPEEPGVVTNVVLQDRCPHDAFEHVLLTHDPFALAWALNALGTDGPADPAFVPTGCL
ncbi:MAG TPA: alpha/beta fold hydrolase [Actinomycetota bacterium]|nr:alpha/beta fold hydrolase [Actinomycetota bacterium]